MSREPEIESAELARLEVERDVDPVERVQARQRAHAALFGDSLMSGQPPIRVDRYELISKAGAGGLGTVWKAYDPKLDREVAIKLLRRDQLGAGQRARRQLMAEATLMARLTHPNVVRVYDVGEAQVDFGPSSREPEPQLYVAMEFVDGQTLRRWQHEREHSVAELLSVYSQAAAGLLAAHEAKLVHGDFKPDNVLIDNRGRVLVTDFAVTRNIVRERVEYELSTLESPTESERNNRVRESIAAVLIGTPAYMSPEQLDGEIPDARSDQFGFCVALWEAVTGERPFAGRTFAALREGISAGPPPFPAGVRPARLRNVLARGLAENPAERYPDLQALLDDLAGLERSKPRRAAALAGASLLVGLGFAVVVPQLLAVEPNEGATTEAAPTEVAAVEQSCVDEAQAAAAEQWSDTQRKTLRSHWAELASEQALARVEFELTRWHERWIAASQSACEEQRAGKLDGDSYALRRTCLDRDLQSFGVLVALLSNAQAEALSHVGAALGSLPVSQMCSDPSHAQRVAAADPSFENPEQRHALADARESLERAEYLYLLRELDDALALIEPILGLTESLGWDAGHARGLLLRGSARLALGHAEAAEDDLFEASLYARRAGRFDIEAKALIGLARKALDAAAREDSKRWLDLAAAAVESAHDPALQAELAVVREAQQQAQ